MSEARDERTIVHRLGGSGTWEDLASSVKALTFGHMVRIATPLMVEYQSDLFHDAFDLDSLLNRNEGVAQWYFVVRQSGTAFVGDTTDVQHFSGDVYQMATYVTDDGTWYLAVTYIGKNA